MSVERLLDYLEPKTFSKIPYAAVVIWILTGVIFLGIFADMENNEPRFDFNCGGAKSENIKVVQGICYEEYVKQTCFRCSFHHPTNSIALSFKVFL